MSNTKRPAWFIDRTGHVYGRLTVIKESCIRSKQGRVCWDCLCECGNSCTVEGDKLQSGNTKSCGCLALETRTIHGMWKTKLYQIWQGLEQRCHNENDNHYHSYGARGIYVCEEWRHQFETFRDWNYANFPNIDNLLASGYQLERIDNDGPYAPWNCRWATRKEQGRNTRKTRWVEVYGEKMSMAEAIERFAKVPSPTVWSRVDKFGWDIEKALTTPPKQRSRHSKK